MKQILNWFRLRRLNDDLDRELDYHVDRRAGELTDQGVPAAEARRRARLELGQGPEVVREEVRDIWLTRWLRDVAYALRFSARAFRRSPSFTATAVLSLALGIGATTAIYSLVQQVVLRPLPVREPERLVLVDWPRNPVGGGFGSYNLMPYPICRELGQQTRVFEGVLCRAAVTVSFSTGADAERTGAEVVSGSYFQVLGVQAALGRLLTPDDDGAPGASPVVVLSHDFWIHRLGGARDIVGRKVFLNRNPMTVVGVAAPDFRGVDIGEVPALWLPASMAGNAIPRFIRRDDRYTRWMQVLGRLRPGVDLAQASAGLDPWFHAMREEDMRRPGFPQISAETRRRYLETKLEITPAPHGHSVLRRRMSQPLWVLLVGTGLLLALACLNVAGLFLARGSARDRELSTRFALGASRGRIGRQLLADGLLMALAGGLLGLALAPVVMRALIAFLPQDAAPNALRSGIDWRLLMFGFAISAVAGILAGAAPAWQAGRGSLFSALKERGGSASAGLRMRKMIVTVQIAFTLILVIAAGLFVRTLGGLLAKGPGFDTTRLMSFGIDPMKNGYTTADANRLVRRIEEELRASPNVQRVARVHHQLLNGGSWNNPMTILAGDRWVTDREAHLNLITPSFFDTLGARVVAGRNFDERDVQSIKPGGTRPAIVNEAFVRRYLRGRSALGARLGIGNGPDVQPNSEVLGVVSDISYRGLREDREQVYFPIANGPEAKAFEGGNFYVRVQGSPEAASQAMRQILRAADPGLPLTYFRTLDEQVNRSLSLERMMAAISGSFGALALLLSLVGLYGVMSFVVTQRTREIGIRLALGASRAGALRLVLLDASWMVAAGVAIALPVVWALGRWMQSEFLEVKPTDPATVALATVILCAASLAAVMIPAYRASAVNPTEALRFE